ncbi:hypothetical protein V757_02250 [Pelistega indica]|uniref:DUF927 domain-containing protein n=1 Tax=Pelistega indica TaxID=1414851 RepID=V8G9J5_9BURK|nr:DUF927 domain-containing protein [Pelistega indica]ETD72781.1 hypothetical protein V757_02250 [Pelistega indica]
MTLLEFFNLVLPSEGIYCLATRSSTNGKWYNESFRSVAKLAEACARIAHTKDVWYGTATYKHEKQYDAKHDTNRFHRTMANVDKLKALRLDIDVGKPDTYANAKEAVMALYKFVEATALPLPYVVSSGYGLHVYWALTQAITLEEWLPMANKLRALCIGKELLVDSTTTIDATRVLRPVGAFNFKRDTKRPVRCVAEGVITSAQAIDAILTKAAEPYTEYLKLSRNLGKYDARFAIPDANIDPVLLKMLQTSDEIIEDAKRFAEPIIKGCQQVREAGRQSEPTWHRMISLMKYCENYEEFIHQLSAIDERYDSGVTQDKIDSTQMMPVTCSEFNSLRPDVCQSCQHWQVISTPLQLGIKTIDIPVKVEYTPPPPPIELPKETMFDVPNMVPSETRYISLEGWKHNSFEVRESGIFKKVPNRDGDEKLVKVCKHVLTPLQERYDANRDLTSLWVIGEDKTDTSMLVEVPNRLYHESSQLVAFFAAKGVQWEDKTGSKSFSEYIRAVTSDARDKGLLMNIPAYNRLGWGDNYEFVLGDKVIMPDGTILDYPNMPLGGLEKEVRAVGDLQAWVSAANTLYADPKDARAALIFLHAFSSPLMHFFRDAEATLTFVVGESGVGKSTIAKVMHSVWMAPPNFAKGAGDKNSSTGATMNSLFRSASVLHNLPFYIDEATLWDTGDVKSYVFDITSGREKSRLTDSIRQRDAGEWHTQAIATANESLCDKLMVVENGDATAQLYRVIEFNLQGVSTGPVHERAIHTMLANYGVAGVQYARFLVKNAASGRLQQVLDANVQKYVEEFSFTQPERYWRAWAVSILTGMELSRAAGLHNIPAQTIVEEVKTVIQEQRQRLKDFEESKTTWFAHMYNSIRENTLIVADMPDIHANGRTIKGAVYTPTREILARVNTSTGIIEVSKKAINNWCGRHGVNKAAFYKEVMKHTSPEDEIQFVRDVNVIFGYGVAGMDSTTARIPCLRVQMKPEDLEETIAIPTTTDTE